MWRRSLIGLKRWQPNRRWRRELVGNGMDGVYLLVARPLAEGILDHGN